MIDSHCHLEFKHFDGDRGEVIDRSERRLKAVVDSCAEIDHAEKVLELHKQHPGFIFASLGLHPSRAVNTPDGELEKYRQFIRENAEDIVAIGEVGLDYTQVKGEEKVERSKEIFLDFIELSDELDLPVVIHARKSMEDTLEILKEKDGDVVIHCFAGDLGDVEEALKRDYYLSFGGMVFRSPYRYREILERVPLDNLLLETDAPFLAKKKGDRSEPWFIREVAEKIATVKGCDFEEVWKGAGINAREVFGLPIDI